MLQDIGFGGGCHWCTEAVFAHLRGVSNVRQGFIKSKPPHDSFSEAVILSYAPEVINLRTLIEIHLRTHSSQSDHKMRGKYRSAIYVFGDRQAGLSREALHSLQPDFKDELVTQVLECIAFKDSDSRFQNYYENGPEKPFCKAYIDPKLKLLRENYADYSKD